MPTKSKRPSIEDGLPPARDPLGWIGGDQPTAAPAEPRPQAKPAPAKKRPAAKKAKPAKSEKRPLATFRLAQDVRAALYELAEAEAVSPAELAELAISRLLADIEAGRFDLAAEKEAATWKIRR